MRTYPLIIALLILAGCASTPEPQPEPEAKPLIDYSQFITGRSVEAKRIDALRVLNTYCHGDDIKNHPICVVWWRDLLAEIDR